VIEIIPSILAVLWCLSFPFVVILVSYLHWKAKFHERCHLYWHKAWENDCRKKDINPESNLDDTEWLRDPDW